MHAPNVRDPSDPLPGAAAEARPILVVPYMWIGDFVRCHTVARLLRARFPDRPVDVLATPLTAPLADYMPGVRKAVVADLPRSRIALGRQRELARRLAREGYGQALVMPRTWKSALAPWLAGIPVRTGFVGEARFGLLNDARRGERRLPRMVDRCGALALTADARLPDAWPPPQLFVVSSEVAEWRRRRRLEDARPVVALAPGAVGKSKRWPAANWGVIAGALRGMGIGVWVLGGPLEKPLAQEIVARSGGAALDLTGEDLRDAIIALAAANACISNDSGLLHVAAALGTPTVGIFGPTSPWHWAPLNPLAATIEAETEISCRPCHKPECRMLHHRCMRDIGPDKILQAVSAAIGRTELAAPAH